MERHSPRKIVYGLLHLAPFTSVDVGIYLIHVGHTAIGCIRGDVGEIRDEDSVSKYFWSLAITTLDALVQSSSRQKCR